MKRIVLLIGIVTISLFPFVTFAQSSCKVLLPKIGDTYTGTCKQGLANGQGDRERLLVLINIKVNSKKVFLMV